MTIGYDLSSVFGGLAQHGVPLAGLEGAARGFKDAVASCG
jgi:hypothetical protein